jgi:hypothetical protein
MAISAAQERIQRCERAMIDRLASWRLRPAVDALMAFKGFQLLAAMITVSELGALQRFAHPRQVMAYLGWFPGESTSGDKRRQGAITKTGNSHARWILIECAQHYATPPKVSKELSHRQSGQSREVLALSWKACTFGRKAPHAQQDRRRHRSRTLRLHRALLRNQSCYLQSDEHPKQAASGPKSPHERGTTFPRNPSSKGNSKLALTYQIPN